MASTDSSCSVDDEVQLVLRCLLERVQSMSTVFEGVPIKLEPRHHHQAAKKNKGRSTTSKPKKRRIFSSSEDDSSSSSDESSSFDDKDTLINDDSESDADEQKALRNRQGPRTRNELAVDDLPPIENLTITLSEETPIERIGRIRHIIDGKLVIVESLLHSPALNDDSVLFNRERRSIGLIFETFGPVEKPYYSIRYNDLDSIQQRQLQLDQEVFYAPQETTYTKYVFVQELRALKGSDASWEDDNEPPKFALDYSDDEQEKEARAILRGKRTLEGPADAGMNADTPSSSSSHPSIFPTSSYSNANRGRGRGRGARGFRGGGGGAGASDNRPPPNLPNWFQSRPSASAHAAPWQSGNSMSTSISNPFASTGAGHAVTNHHADDRPMRPASHQGNPSTHSAFPWM